MRKIMFRGKKKDNGHWIYGGYYFDDCYGNKQGEKHYIVIWNSTGLGFYQEVEIAPETRGQFTALHDKDDIGIFEGDIVRAVNNGWHRTFEIKWIKDLARFMAWEGSQPNISFDLTCDNIIQYQVEIIGNIHDNPRLLREE